MSESYKHQRDSYIAYSLAAADLLIEIGHDLKIHAVVGASRALLGRDSREIIGARLTDFFQPCERDFLAQKLKEATCKGRIDPLALYLSPDGKTPVLINLGACFIASKPNDLHITISLAKAMRPQGDTVPIPDEVMPRDQAGMVGADYFNALALNILSEGLGAGGPQDLEMILVRLRGLSDARSNLQPEQRTLLMQEIGLALRMPSVSGQPAAHLGDDGFGLLTRGQDQAATQALIVQGIEAAAQSAGLPSGSLTPNIVSVNLATGDLEPAAIRKALAYITQNFSNATAPIPACLAEGLEAAMTATVTTFAHVKSVIDTGNFDLLYQPIVRLFDKSVHHHEALLRLSDGRNLYETINFSEQIGLIHDLDIAICRKVLKAISIHSDAVVALNISGQSISNPQFGIDLMKLVMPYRNLSARILFEITETGEVVDFATARKCISSLRQLGFKLCLDDFGSGAASYNYLRHFEVDFVKIDGPFLREAVTDGRQRALIRSVVNLSHELGCQVIGEMIETPQMEQLACDLSIEMGQGYLFGRPGPDLTAASNRSQAGQTLPARRNGVSEAWG